MSGMTRPVAKYDIDNVSIKHTDLWKPLNNVGKESTKKRKRNDDINEYISGTQIKNYLLKDPMLDWLEMYYEKYGFNEKIMTRGSAKVKKFAKLEPIESGLDIFFEGGNDFEEKINIHLTRLFSGEIVTINVDGRSGVTLENFEKTKQAIFTGIPIILQGVILSNENKTRGVTDILIRSDYINKLVKREVMTTKKEKIKANKLNGNYHYVVVDIKWTTMSLCANGYNIRNDHRFPSYKGQLAIYNAILGEIQGYTPPEAYIMAKAWKIDSKKNPDHGYNCYDLLGVIDYDGFDNSYIQKTVSAINWLNDVKHQGSSWSPLCPKREEMYPNASNKSDAPWTKVKKDICDKIDEITQIWYVSDWNRTKAHEQGIMTWRDKRCNSLTLGITGDTKPNTIDELLDINRNPNGTISPDIIINNLMNWQESSPVDFYVDFETINTCFLETNVDIKNSKTEYDIIFMIGIGYIRDGKWNFIRFVANSPTISEEYNILNKFTNFITQKALEFDPINEFVPRLFHWSHAEVTGVEHANRRHNNKWTEWGKSVLWTDMYHVFTNEPVVVKGSLNFKLKSIGKAMHKLGYVETVWEDTGPSDGLEAMISAIKLYKSKIFESDNDITNEVVMQDIIKYNEIDCKIIWEIVHYLRKHNCKQGMYEYDLNIYE